MRGWFMRLSHACVVSAAGHSCCCVVAGIALLVSSFCLVPQCRRVGGPPWQDLPVQVWSMCCSGACNCAR